MLVFMSDFKIVACGLLWFKDIFILYLHYNNEYLPVQHIQVQVCTEICMMCEEKLSVGCWRDISLHTRDSGLKYVHHDVFIFYCIILK